MSDDDITGGLDLLGDWLDAKGYTEEAGLCTLAMDEINKLRTKLKAANEQTIRFERLWYLRGAENEKLRAERDNALHKSATYRDELNACRNENIALRAAAAALKETGDE